MNITHFYTYRFPNILSQSARSLVIVALFAVLLLAACTSETAPTTETQAAETQAAAVEEEASETQTVVPFDPMVLPTALPAVPIDIPDPSPRSSPPPGRSGIS